MKEIVNAALEASKAIRLEVSTYGSPSEDGTPAYSQQVLPASLTRGTRGYIERIANQVNGCYEKGWYDSCAVMIRRLIETLIIEAFEHNKLSLSIKNKQGEFLYLNDLIDRTLTEGSWNLSRNTKAALKNFKSVGDKSAHSRRFNARRWDIDKIVDDLRTASEEFLYLAALK